MAGADIAAGGVSLEQIALSGQYPAATAAGGARATIGRAPYCTRYDGTVDHDEQATVDRGHQAR